MEKRQIACNEFVSFRFIRTIVFVATKFGHRAGRGCVAHFVHHSMLFRAIKNPRVGIYDGEISQKTWRNWSVGLADSFHLSTMSRRSAGLVVSVLAGLSQVRAQVGVSLCACQPSVYTFKFNFTAVCDVDTIDRPGVRGVDCFARGIGQDASDPMPIQVTAVTVLELDRSLRIMAQSPYLQDFRDGSTFTYTSVGGTPEGLAGLTLDRIPGGLQLDMVGINQFEEPVTNVWIILFENDCGIFPVLEVGDAVGWTIIDDIRDPSQSVCPIAPATDSLSTAPVVPLDGTTAPSSSMTKETASPSFFPSMFPTTEELVSEPTQAPQMKDSQTTLSPQTTSAPQVTPDSLPTMEPSMLQSVSPLDDASLEPTACIPASGPYGKGEGKAGGDSASSGKIGKSRRNSSSTGKSGHSGGKSGMAGSSSDATRFGRGTIGRHRNHHQFFEYYGAAARGVGARPELENSSSSFSSSSSSNGKDSSGSTLPECKSMKSPPIKKAKTTGKAGSKSSKLRKSSTTKGSLDGKSGKYGKEEGKASSEGSGENASGKGTEKKVISEELSRSKMSRSTESDLSGSEKSSRSSKTSVDVPSPTFGSSSKTTGSPASAPTSYPSRAVQPSSSPAAEIRQESSESEPSESLQSESEQLESGDSSSTSESNESEGKKSKKGKRRNRQ